MTISSFRLSVSRDESLECFACERDIHDVAPQFYSFIYFFLDSYNTHKHSNNIFKAENIYIRARIVKLKNPALHSSSSSTCIISVLRFIVDYRDYRISKSEVIDLDRKIKERERKRSVFRTYVRIYAHLYRMRTPIVVVKCKTRYKNSLALKLRSY